MSENLPTDGRAAASCMIAAMFVVGYIDNFIVLLAETVSIWQFQALRAAIALPLILGLSAFGAGSILPKRFWAVLLRSLFLTISMLFYFGSLALWLLCQWRRPWLGFLLRPFFIADHRIGVGGKDRTDTCDCGFFGLFGYSIGAQ
jgi:hypothetical protein